MFKQENLRMLGLKLTIMGNFHPLEVVGCGSETQLQVGEKKAFLARRSRGD